MSCKTIVIGLKKKKLNKTAYMYLCSKVRKNKMKFYFCILYNNQIANPSILFSYFYPKYSTL